MVILILFVSISTQLSVASNEANMTKEEMQELYNSTVKKIWDGFDKQHGDIKLPNGVATLHVPENFFYIGPEDTEKMLTQIWGNPPSTARTLGMLFPSNATATSQETWGVTIEYQEDGYVSDENAEEIDYTELLTTMQENIEESNKERKAQGYEAIHLIGWAASPYYDKTSHKLHWAQELQFGSQSNNTLNYNIRVLGRKGVLILNFIAGMDQLSMIDEQIDTVLDIAEFNEGSRYTDFNPDIDKVAAYGIGALIAGKVAAKLGILATILLMLKKFWILAALGIGGFFKKLFGKKE